MKPHLLRSLGLAGLVLAGTLGGTHAQASSQNGPQRPTVTSDLEAARVLSLPSGKEMLVAAEGASPGDVIEYQVTYTNHTAETVRDLKATLPIPTALEYLPETASPARVDASVDQVTFEPTPLRREVRTASGARSLVEVPAAEYRALRWTIPALAPGKSVQVKARARLPKS